MLSSLPLFRWLHIHILSFQKWNECIITSALCRGFMFLCANPMNCNWYFMLRKWNRRAKCNSVHFFRSLAGSYVHPFVRLFENKCGQFGYNKTVGEWMLFCSFCCINSCGMLLLMVSVCMAFRTDVWTCLLLLYRCRWKLKSQSIETYRFPPFLFSLPISQLHWPCNSRKKVLLHKLNQNNTEWDIKRFTLYMYISML